MEHLRFMGVHDAAHVNLEGGASQQGHLILAVPCKYYELSCACVCAELAEQENQEGCPQQFGCRDMQYVELPGTSRLDTDDVGTDDHAVILCSRIVSNSSRLVPAFLSPTAKAFTMQSTKKGQPSVYRQEIGN